MVKSSQVKTANKRQNLKKVFYTLVAVIVLGAGGYVGVKYINTQPERTTADFVNLLSKNGDVAQAYNLTTPTYKKNVSLAQFVVDFAPLIKSQAKYSVLGYKKVGNTAITAGLINDLDGSNFEYLINLSHLSGSWQINSVTIGKE